MKYINCMNLIGLFERFPDQQACIDHMERIRWRGFARCPYCASDHVARKHDGHRVGRWNCHACKSSFNVLSGTIFAGTKVPLQKWFLGIAIMVNAKKSVSSYQLGRDLDLTEPTALYMQHRIRSQMAGEQKDLLTGIIEADETYVGGKPRKSWDGRPPGAPRGRGTRKTPVIGAVERGGNVVARVADDLTGKGVLQFVKRNVDPEASILITDEYAAYNAIDRMMPHNVIDHSRQYVDGPIHTNTIEGFWSLIKRAFYGTHHNYSRKYMGLFVAESCWKYNQRGNEENSFGAFVRGCFA